jgi:amidase
MRGVTTRVLLLAVVLSAGCARAMTPTTFAKPFDVVDTGIPDLQNALAEGRVTSRQLVVEYLTRIALYEDQVKAIVFFL